MRTHRAGRIHIDQQKLAAEIDRSMQFSFSEAYSDYLCGGPWRSCMLWAPGGRNGDGRVTNYDHGQRPARTEYGEQLPYLCGLIERHFNLDFLNFVRLVVISNSVIIPHRDLLELNDIPVDTRNAHRVHIPLVTNEHCFFMHENIVYRMRSGEVWFFDAATPHSAASFSTEKRVHLMIDFSYVADRSKLVRFPLENETNIPAESIFVRDPMTEGERKKLLALSNVIDLDNFSDVFGIVIKNHYRKDGGDDSIWSTFLEIAKSSGNPEVGERAGELHRYLLIERAV